MTTREMIAIPHEAGRIVRDFVFGRTEPGLWLPLGGG